MDKFFNNFVYEKNFSLFASLKSVNTLPHHLATTNSTLCSLLLLFPCLHSISSGSEDKMWKVRQNNFLPMNIEGGCVFKQGEFSWWWKFTFSRFLFCFSLAFFLCASLFIILVASSCASSLSTRIDIRITLESHRINKKRDSSSTTWI